MSSNSIIFTILKTNVANKQTEIDSNGYYKVTLGAFNTFNSSGSFYLADGVRDLIENKSSILHKRLTKGYLNGEMGHPAFVPGMTRDQFFTRNLYIDQSNVSHHIKEIILTPTNIDSGMPGKGNVLRVDGWIKPAGPHGELLKQALDNPDQNVAFSIRSFTEDSISNGRTIKKLLNIITWDWVLEPGIKLANQWDTISLESNEILRLDIDELVKNGQFMDNVGISNESEDIKSILEETISNKRMSNNCNDLLLKW